MDSHFAVLRDHGHIKFWSMKSLGVKLRQTGFEVISFERVGQMSVLAKAMIAIAPKP